MAGRMAQYAQAGVTPEGLEMRLRLLEEVIFASRQDFLLRAEGQLDENKRVNYSPLMQSRRAGYPRCLLCNQSLLIWKGSQRLGDYTLLLKRGTYHFFDNKLVLKLVSSVCRHAHFILFNRSEHKSSVFPYDSLAICPYTIE